MCDVMMAKNRNKILTVRSVILPSRWRNHLPVVSRCGGLRRPFKRFPLPHSESEKHCNIAVLFNRTQRPTEESSFRPCLLCLCGVWAGSQHKLVFSLQINITIFHSIPWFCKRSLVRKTQSSMMNVPKHLEENTRISSTARDHAVLHRSGKSETMHV